MVDMHNNLEMMDECIDRMIEISDSIQDTSTLISVALDVSDSSLSGKRQEKTREVITEGYGILQEVKEAIDSGCRDLEKLRDYIQEYLSLKFQR